MLYSRGDIETKSQNSVAIGYSVFPRSITSVTATKIQKSEFMFYPFVNTFILTHTFRGRLGRMGKKQNGKGPNLDVAPPLPQKELYQRVNFALQSSTFLQQLGESSQTRKGKRKAQDGSDHHVEDEDVSGQGLGDVLNELSRGQMKSTKKMAAHTQLKLCVYLFRLSCRGADVQRPKLEKIYM